MFGSKLMFNIMALIVLMTIVSFMNVRRQVKEGKKRREEFEKRGDELRYLKDTYVVDEEIYQKFMYYNFKKQKKQRI